MSKINFYIWFVIFLISCTGTNRIGNKYSTAIELVNMRVLYARENNQINILVDGLELNDIDVSINNGTISGNQGKYVVVPEAKGTADLTIRYKGKLIQETRYKVKMGIKLACYLMTDSNIYYMDYRGYFTKHELLNDAKILIDTPNSDFDTEFEIKEFTLSIKVNDSIIDLVSYNNQFTNEQKNLIRQAQNGSNAIIWNTIITRQDSTSLKLAGFDFDIVDD